MFGVRGKLILSFATVTFLTVLVSVVGLFSFRNFETAFNDIVDVKLPPLEAAQELSNEVQDIISSSLVLMNATSLEEKNTVLARITKQQELLSATMKRLELLELNNDIIVSIEPTTNRLTSQIRQLGNEVAIKIGIQEKRRGKLVEIVSLDEKTGRIMSNATAIGADPLLMSDYKQSLKLLVTNIFLASAANTPEQLQKTTDSALEAEDEMNYLTDDFEGATGDSVTAISADYSAFVKGTDSIPALRANELEQIKKLSILFDEIRALSVELRQITANLLRQINTDISISADKTNKEIGIGTLIIISAALASIIISVLILWLYMIRSLLGRLKRLQENMLSLAEGELEIEIESDSGDEIGNMAGTVKIFHENAQKIKRLEAQQKEQETQAAEEKKRAMNQMADDFEASTGHLLTTVTSAVGAVREEAENMLQTARKTNIQATTVANASNIASDSVNTVAIAAEELSSSISEISSQVANAAVTSRNAVDCSNESNAQVSSLAEAAKKVGEVVNLISDIAEQTNLLALNATIEAARAGDAGKGFAVVAGEVKNLANQTAKATEEISSQMTSIQTATKGAIGGIQQITRVIGEIDEISSGISAAVEEQGAATGEIAQSAQQAAGGTSEVNNSISEVTSMSDKAGESAQNLQNAASELSQQMDALKTRVDTFIGQIRTE